MPLDHDWLCRRLVEDSPDAIICADQEGLIRLWNRGAEAMFGFPAAEALGRPLDLIIPENLRARHGEGYRRVMAGRDTAYAQDLLAVPALRRDGSRISVEFTIVLIRGEGGGGARRGKSWAPGQSSGRSPPAGKGKRRCGNVWRPWKRNWTK